MNDVEEQSVRSGRKLFGYRVNWTQVLSVVVVVLVILNIRTVRTTLDEIIEQIFTKQGFTMSEV